MSQLDLASAAGASSRHISFIETGRSRPGEALVVRLAETLDVPLRERNELLRAAGLPPLYAEEGLDAATLAPFRAIVDQLLDQHAPYPAFAIDRWWTLVRANGPARLAFGGIPEGTDLYDAMLAPGSVAERIVNLADVAWAALEQVRTEAIEAPDDPRLQALLARLEARAAELGPPRGPVGPVVCPVLDVGDGRQIRTITAIARFGTARSVTLDELRVELIYPGDEAAEAWFRSLADPGSAE